VLIDKLCERKDIPKITDVTEADAQFIKDVNTFITENPTVIKLINSIKKPADIDPDFTMVLAHELMGEEDDDDTGFKETIVGSPPNMDDLITQKKIQRSAKKVEEAMDAAKAAGVKYTPNEPGTAET
jgi:hypothetical protein